MDESLSCEERAALLAEVEDPELLALTDEQRASLISASEEELRQTIEELRVVLRELGEEERLPELLERALRS
jgi:hypothetical protein